MVDVLKIQIPVGAHLMITSMESSVSYAQNHWKAAIFVTIKAHHVAIVKQVNIGISRKPSQENAHVFNLVTGLRKIHNLSVFVRKDFLIETIKYVEIVLKYLQDASNVKTKLHVLNVKILLHLIQWVTNACVLTVNIFLLTRRHVKNVHKVYHIALYVKATNKCFNAKSVAKALHYVLMADNASV